jgi:hypothetical protein
LLWVKFGAQRREKKPPLRGTRSSGEQSSRTHRSRLAFGSVQWTMNPVMAIDVARVRKNDEGMTPTHLLV